MPNLKELNYFSNDENYSKGNDFYHSFFTDAPSSLTLMKPLLNICTDQKQLAGYIGIRQLLS